MKVDAHHHLWELARFPQPWLTEGFDAIRRDFLPKDLHIAAASHVDQTVLVQTVSDLRETPALLDYAKGEPLIGAVVGWVDLTSPKVADQLSALRESLNGGLLRGVRHQVQDEDDPRWLCRAEVRAGLRAVAEAGLTYDLLTLPHQLPAAIETVEALPQLQFVLNHLSKPDIGGANLRNWEHEIGRLAKSPNVSCKLSGLVTQAQWGSWTAQQLRPHAHIALDAFGPGRVMFGSDWPVCLVAASYETTLQLAHDLTDHLTGPEKDMVFGTTAERVYRLEPQP